MVEYVPNEALFKYITPQVQKDRKACTSFAIAHGLETQYAMRGEKICIDANKLRKAQLKFLGKDEMKSISFDEGFKIFADGYKGIECSSPVKMKFDFDRIRRWIWKGYPIFMVLGGKQTHAVVAVGFGDDFLWIIDSLGGKYRRIADFDIIKESYIIFLPFKNVIKPHTKRRDV